MLRHFFNYRQPKCEIQYCIDRHLLCYDLAMFAAVVSKKISEALIVVNKLNLFCHLEGKPHALNFLKLNRTTTKGGSICSKTFLSLHRWTWMLQQAAH